MTLSNAEVNALLAESPELRLFQHGVVVAFDHISAQVYCTVPLDLPFLPRRYLNCSFETRPSMHGEGLELDVSRIERDGKPLGAAEVRQYRVVIVPLIEKFLSSMNKIRGDRAVRDLRIENGNLVLGDRSKGGTAGNVVCEASRFAVCYRAKPGKPGRFAYVAPLADTFPPYAPAIPSS